MGELVTLIRARGFHPSGGASVRDGVWVTVGIDGFAMVDGRSMPYAAAWAWVQERFPEAKHSTA